MGARQTVAKVTKPDIAADYPRERLFDALDASRDKPVIWVSGPGGAGKTHLLASYLENRDLDSIWYHVDHGDTDVASFFYYLGLAAQHYSTGNQSSLPLLNPDFAFDLSRFSFRFFEELFHRMALPGLLVLDNLQEVHDKALLYRVIQDAATRVPKGMSIVAISRNDPPARFAPLRLAGSLVSLRWHDIQFTLPEFAGAAGVLWEGELYDSEIDELHRDLEGWVAGLVLTFEQSRLSGKKPAQLSQRNTREVSDFFVADIWDAMRPEIRDFLRKTACFPFMTGAMARELTGELFSEKILSYLSSNNLFTLRFEPGPRYRYHNLFREFLIHQLKEKMTYDEVYSLKKNAAAILLQEGYPEESAELLIEEYDWEGLESLVWYSAPELFKQGRIHTIQGWMKRVPRPIKEFFPRLLYWQARCALSLDPLERRDLFTKAYSLFEKYDDRDGLLLSWAGIVMTYLHSQKRLDQLDHLIERFEDLSAYYSSNRDGYVRVQVATSMFVAMILRQPNHPDAHEWARAACSDDRIDLDMHTKIHLVLGLALQKYYTGNIPGLRKALENLAPAMLETERHLPNNLTMYLALMALNRWLEFELEECVEYAREGLRVSEKMGGTIWDGLLLGQQVNARLSQGDLTEAKKGLDLFRTLLNRLPPLSISYYHQRMAWYCLARGDHEEALVNALEGRRLADIAGVPNNQAFSLIALAEVYASLSEDESAVDIMRQARKMGLELKNNLILFQCALLEARMSCRSGREEETDKRLATALGIGALNSVANWQFLCPMETTKLITRALNRGIETDYVLDLIEKWNLKPEGDLWDLKPWPWPIKVYTMGRFELVRHGKPLRFEGKVQHRPLELLKAIIALGGRNVAAERLIEALWPDSAGDAGHRTLETNLLRLRRLLGIKNAVVLKNGRLSLDPEIFWVDVWAFERAFSLNGDIISANNCSTVERAMELYRGTFLPNDDTQAWSMVLRERIQHKFIRLAIKCGTYLEETGDHDRAVECYRHALDLCPLSEKLYHRLMLCYEKVGRRGEAINTYHSCQRVFSAAYGIQPGKTMRDLHERLIV